MPASIFSLQFGKEIVNSQGHTIHHYAFHEQLPTTVI